MIAMATLAQFVGNPVNDERRMRCGRQRFVGAAHNSFLPASRIEGNARDDIVAMPETARGQRSVRCAASMLNTVTRYRGEIETPGVAELGVQFEKQQPGLRGQMPSFRVCGSLTWPELGHDPRL
jgi:hypothetical protein